MGDYTKKGTCIWCLKSKPETTFNNKPHTIPRGLNIENIGFDICDSCNSYFGTDEKGKIVTYSLDKIIKEFFFIHKFMLSKRHELSWRDLRSQFFVYQHNKGKLKIKVDYILNPTYANEFTRKFKRGIYCMFLQEYHRITENGLDARFDTIRNFVRDDKGDIPLYYLVNNVGIRMTEDLDLPLQIPFTEFTLKRIDDYGYYHMMMTGLNFYLAITDQASQNIEWLKDETNKSIGSGFVFSKLIELRKINQIDFTLAKWNR